VTYRIEFTPTAREHFAALTAGERALVRDGVRAQLMHQPTVETRRRKPLRPNTLAGFRLRIRHLRVYHDVLEERIRLTLVQAIGVKVRNRIRVGGEEIEL
jgi:mRNA-degrading endonuclease RelE of RelBE toxin-antitoxin system